MRSWDHGLAYTGPLVGPRNEIAQGPRNRGPECSPLMKFTLQSKVGGLPERRPHHPAGTLSLTNRHPSGLREGLSSCAGAGWPLPLAMAVGTAKLRGLQMGTDPRREGA